MTFSALLGYFCYKDMKNDRLQCLEKCRRHLINFLRLCKNYGITNVDLPAEDPSSDEGTKRKGPKPGSQAEIVDMAMVRKAKIDRYKKQKSDENRLKNLYEQVKKEHVDDEIKVNVGHLQ